MKRLFLAVDIDERSRAEVGRIASNLRERLDPRSRISWVRPDRLHLTLHFFAGADELLEQRIVSALDEPVREPPFRLALEGLGCFPPRGAPRVLWLGLGEGIEEIRRVHQGLQVRLGTTESRADPFTPHLTLARLRDRISPSQVREIGGIRASAGPCLIDRVTLYESRISPAGPTYVRRAEAPLMP